MDQSLQLQLAIAHAYVRGKKQRELKLRVALSAKRRQIRGSTVEAIMRRLAQQK